MNNKNLPSLLKDTWNFFKSNSIAILAILLPFVIPLDLINTAADYYSTEEDQYYWLALIPAFFVFPIYQGALILYMASVINRDKLSYKQYYKRASNFWLPLMGLYIIGTLAIMGGFILLIIPGLIVTARIAFSEFYCILQGQKPLQAISSSWHHTQKYQWKILLGLVILYSISILPLWGLDELVDSLCARHPLYTLFSGVMASILYTPITIFNFRVFTLHQETLEKHPG